MRTWFAADKTGFHMLHTLFQTSLRYPVTRYDETFVTKLMVEDGRVCGVVAIELKTGKVRVITAKAVIICTGGCGRVFPYTTNANICTGDGMALAYEAGAPLKDMEMVQYHPTGLPFTGILITEASRAEGGLLRQQGRLPLSAGLQPGQAAEGARAAQHGARPARSPLAGLRQGDGEGAHDQRPLRRRGPSRSAPSGRGKKSTPSSRWCASCASSTRTSIRSMS